MRRWRYYVRNLSGKLWYHGTLRLFNLITRLSHKEIEYYLSDEDRESILNLKKDHGFVIAANHNDYTNAWALASILKNILPTISFLVLQELLDYQEQFNNWEGKLKNKIHSKKLLHIATMLTAKLTNLFVGKSYSIPIDRHDSGSRLNLRAGLMAKEILLKKGVVGVFPEGGIDEKEVKSGVIRIAKMSDAIILPVYIAPKPKPWNSFNPWPVVIGKPIIASEIETLDVDSTGDLPNKLMNHIADLANRTKPHRVT